MRSKFTNQEKFDIIMKCRNSGFSDYQWCKHNDISQSTFYGWTQQLKKAGFNLPEPADKDSFAPTTHQDVVKLEVLDDISLPITSETFAEPIVSDKHSIEIEIGRANIKISNDVSPNLLAQIMSGLGGCL